MVQEEYHEEDDDDEDGESVAMASVAIAKTPRVSPFDSPNENITAKCLMAKATNKVTPNIKTTIINHSYLTDCIDEHEGTNVEENEFETFMGKLKGKSKKHFVALLEQLGEANDMIEAHEDTITKMEGHSRDYADEISDLSNALEEECGHCLALEEKATNKVTPNIKTTIINHSYLTDCIDEHEGTNVEENEFETFMGKLKGKSKKHFVALLEQLGEANDMIEAHEDTITKMEGHSRDYADEISDLSNALEEECGHCLALEESHNDYHAKLKKDLDHALVLSRVLTSEKDEHDGPNVEENEFESFMGKLKGKSKKHFVALLEQLGEANDMIEAHEDTISKMEGHSRDYADEISDLSNALEEESGLCLALEESHNVDHAKLKKKILIMLLLFLVC